MSLPKHPVPDPHADPLMASVLRAADGGEPGDCPDVELLGLYAERELGGGEQAQIEAHLQGCARCQAIVAAVVRTMPVAAAGAAVADPVLGGGFRSWFGGWRWLVPAASLTAVAVVAVWLGRGPGDEVAQSAGTAALDTQSLAFAPEARTPQSPATAASGTAAQQAPPAAAEPAPRTEGRARVGAPAPPAAAKAEGATAAGGKRAPTASPAETSPVVAGVVTADAASPERAIAAGRAAETAAAPAATPSAPAAAAPAFRATVAAASWRARRGVVERSRDGVAWEPVAMPDGVEVVAVAPISTDMCWALSSDSVFRVIDGVTWTRTGRPSSGPLTSLSATSALAASVTAGGARFATTDGGATWAPVR